MITLEKFWMGRDISHAHQLNEEIRSYATCTVTCANKLLALYLADTGKEITGVNSGWRPPDINAQAGGAKASNHMSGKAVDIADPDGALDAWCLADPSRLAQAGLWMEHPDATPGWCHLQIVAPRSGNRIFKP